MKRALGLSWLLVVGVVVGACSSGSDGAAGTTGAMGKMGAMGTSGTSATGTASVSAITPAYAFLDRTVDLTIVGGGTTWDASTKVSFADPKVVVNKVTRASDTGLLINVTVAADAALGPVDVTVTDGKSTALYQGAFQIEAPITVTADPTTGVPQGGLANLHVVMNDLTTPFDPDTITVALSTPDVGFFQPSPTDYAFDLTIQADVLAVAGTFDLTATCGTGNTTVNSPAAQSFKIAARAPTTLAAMDAAAGMIATDLDTELYEFTPASAAQEFVQFTTASMAGLLSGTVLPKDGKYADALDSGFAVRYAEGTTSTDAFFVVVGDSNGLFGAGPTPADTSLVAFESPCTAASETAETASANNDTTATAQVVATLPALVSGTLGYGSVDGTVDVDYYEITVPGVTAKIHVATGGDPYDDALITITAADGTTVLATTPEDDLQKDLVFTATTAGTYYVSVSANNDPNTTEFQDSDNTYQLFIAVE